MISALKTAVVSMEQYSLFCPCTESIPQALRWQKCRKCRERYFGSSLCSILTFFASLCCIFFLLPMVPLAHHICCSINFFKNSMFLIKVIKNKRKFGINRHRSLTPRSAPKSVLLKSDFKDRGEAVTNHVPFSSTSSYGSGTTSSPGAASAPATGPSRAWETRQTWK